MTTAVVLAAGKGRRMHSDLPKVVHPVLGVPMVMRVLGTAASCGFDRVVAVVGFGREALVPMLDEAGIDWVVQEQQLGTAHAVSTAIEGSDHSEVAVLLGDVPLLLPETVGRLLDSRRERDAAMSVLTGRPPDPSGYGRVIRGGGGLVERIVEDRDATPEEAAVAEVNTGLMAFDGGILPGLLAAIGNDNSQGEYYLTDAVGIAVSRGLCCAACAAADWAEVSGVNDPFQLAAVSRALSRRNVARLMAAGVRFTDPEGVWIEDGAAVGPGSEIGRFVRLSGRAGIGEGCVIGDGCIVGSAAVPGGTVLEPYTVVGEV